MDLCNQSYGFLHLPSLFVFLNPYSRVPSIRQFFVEGIHIERVPAFVRTLPESDAKDLLQMLTCYVNERKHFHDLLITPYGNGLARSAFRAAMVTTALFSDRKREPPLDAGLPLGASFLRTPTLLELARRTYQECVALLERGVLTLEASASLAQQQFGWQHVGREAVEILQTRDPRYSAVLAALSKLGERVAEDVPGFGTILHKLLLIALGRVPSDGQQHPDEVLAEAVLQFATVPEKALKDRLAKAVEEGWKVVRQNMRISDEDNERFLIDIGRLMTKAGAASEITESVRCAFADFTAKARRARDEILGNEQAFLRLDGYANFEGALVEPCLYHFSVMDEASLSEEPLTLGEGELAAQHVYELRNGKRLYSHRVNRAEMGLERGTMDNRAWVDFVMGVGGSVALLEEVDWLHPVKTLWLRQMEERSGLRFYRRGLLGAGETGTMIA